MPHWSVVQWQGPTSRVANLGPVPTAINDLFPARAIQTCLLMKHNIPYLKISHVFVMVTFNVLLKLLSSCLSFCTFVSAALFFCVYVYEMEEGGWGMKNYLSVLGLVFSLFFFAPLCVCMWVCALSLVRAHSRTPPRARVCVYVCVCVCGFFFADLKCLSSVWYVQRYPTTSAGLQCFLEN